MEWLIPICLYWVLAMVYLGAGSTDVEGGSPLRQVLGLVGAFAAYMIIWVVLRTALGGLGFFGRTILATLVVVLAFPLIVKGVYRVLGVRMVKKASAH